MDFFEVLTNNKLNNLRVGEVVSFSQFAVLFSRNTFHFRGSVLQSNKYIDNWNDNSNKPIYHRIQKHPSNYIKWAPLAFKPSLHKSYHMSKADSFGVVLVFLLQTLNPHLNWVSHESSFLVAKSCKFKAESNKVQKLSNSKQEVRERKKNCHINETVWSSSNNGSLRRVFWRPPQLYLIVTICFEMPLMQYNKELTLSFVLLHHSVHSTFQLSNLFFNRNFYFLLTTL